MQACRHLRPEDVPSWDIEEDTLLPPAGSHRKDPEPAVQEILDVQMYDVTSAPAKKRQIRRTPVQMARAESTGSNAGAKRGPSARLSDKAKGPSKRPRLDTKTELVTRDPSDYLDLSKHVYEEGSRVNPVLVPKVQGEVSAPTTIIRSDSNVEIDLQVLQGQQRGQGGLLSNVAEGTGRELLLLCRLYWQ